MAHFKKEYDTVDSNIKNIADSEELYAEYKKHMNNAYCIYEKSIELNLQNTQEFMDWQDALNEVSQVHKEDI